jgi:fumarylacetoacetate (FAA) hydrolase family protein
MVVAHLRGLLKPSHEFGRRSAATEDIILEAISTEHLASSMETIASADLAVIPALNHKGVTKTVEQVSARLARASELRLFDLYKVAEQLSTKLKVENPQKELSLYQLYQIAEKGGIFDAFDEYYTVEKSRPLL